MPANKIWSDAENAITIGTLPAYRYFVSKGLSKRKSAKLLAQKIFNDDVSNAFSYRRTPHVKNPLITVAAHIIHMDDIAAGTKPAKRDNEKQWFRVYP